MNNLKNTYNSYFRKIKELIDNLYMDALDNENKQEMKSNASYREIDRMKQNLDDYEDNFQDFSKIDSQLDVIYHANQFCLDFEATVRKFIDEYGTKKVYPMIMEQGHPIPGSDFRQIFNDNLYYWGYSSELNTEAYFELRLKQKEPANKIYLSTMNYCDVELFAKSDIEDDYISLGKKSGREHVWDFWPKNIKMVKFVTKGTLFSVRYISVALCKYKKDGKIVTTDYNIDDLYNITINTEANIPPGTDIEFYGVIGNNRFKLDMNKENTISGGVNWCSIKPDDSNYPGKLTNDSYIFGSLGTLIEDSIWMMAGYQKWDVVDIFDYMWKEYIFDVNSTTGVVDINITDDYIIPEESIKNVYSGTTNPRIFERGVDYSVSSDSSSITLDIISTEINTASSLKAATVLRVKKNVRQLRTYITNDYDYENFSLDLSCISTLYSTCYLRIVNLNGSINEDKTYQITGDTIIIDLLKGINLIELELYDNNGDLIEFPTDMNTMVNCISTNNFGYNSVTPSGTIPSGVAFDFFAYNNPLSRIYTENVSSNDYYVFPSGFGPSGFTPSGGGVTGYYPSGVVASNVFPSGTYIMTKAEDVYLKYATERSTDFYIEIVLKGSSGWISPSIKYYKLENFLI